MPCSCGNSGRHHAVADQHASRSCCGHLEGVLDHLLHLAAGSFPSVGDQAGQVHQVQRGVVLHAETGLSEVCPKTSCLLGVPALMPEMLGLNLQLWKEDRGLVHATSLHERLQALPDSGKQRSARLLGGCDCISKANRREPQEITAVPSGCKFFLYLRFGGLSMYCSDPCWGMAAPQHPIDCSSTGATLEPRLMLISW